MMGPQGGGMGVDVMSLVILQPFAERMTQQLELDEKQQARLKALLVARRTEFLKLIDENPPPTIQLGRMMRSREK